MMNNPEAITAYVLDELSPAEVARVEALIAASPELGRRAVDTLAFTQMMQQQLASEAAALLPEQRQALIEQATRNLTPATAPAQRGLSILANSGGYRQAVHQRLKEVQNPNPWVRQAAVIGTLAAAACCLLYIGTQPARQAVSQKASGLATANAPQPGSESVSVQLGTSDPVKSTAIPQRQAAGGLPSTLRPSEAPRATSLPAPTSTLIVEAPQRLTLPPGGVVPRLTQSLAMASPSPEEEVADLTAAPAAISTPTSSSQGNDPQRLGAGYNPNKTKRIDRSANESQPPALLPSPPALRPSFDFLDGQHLFFPPPKLELESAWPYVVWPKERS